MKVEGTARNGEGKEVARAERWETAPGGKSNTEPGDLGPYTLNQGQLVSTGDQTINTNKIPVFMTLTFEFHINFTS